jgi:hypothetical protein
MTEACIYCKFWDRDGPPTPARRRCLRYPPVQIFNGKEPETQWPWTDSFDRCGEFVYLQG